MATPPDDVALDQALAELERRGLVRPALPALVDDDRYEVPQALVRDVAYGRLTARERRRAHGQVARWLERRTGGLRAQDPDVLFALAHHRDAGDDPGAALAWRAAAQRSIELFAFRQALAAARRAWDLAEAAGGADAALAELVGDAATEADTVEVAEARYQRALELTPDDGEHAIARARLWHKLGLAASSRADHARAIERYQRGLALVEPGGELTAEARRDPRLAAALSGSLGWVLAYQLSSPDPRGLALCERACRLLEGTPHRRELAWALSRLGGAYMRAGRLADQLRCNQQNLAIAIELGDLGNQLTARINLGVVLANLDQLDDAVTHTEEALRLCRRTGARVAEGLVLSNLAGYLLDRGELDAAARRLDEAIPLLERTGSRRVLPESYTFVARLAARRGDLAAAAAAAQTSAELAREQGIPFDVGLAMRILAQVEARRGRQPGRSRARRRRPQARRRRRPVEQAQLELAQARVGGWDDDAGRAAGPRDRHADPARRRARPARRRRSRRRPLTTGPTRPRRGRLRVAATAAAAPQLRYHRRRDRAPHRTALARLRRRGGGRARHQRLGLDGGAAGAVRRRAALHRRGADPAPGPGGAAHRGLAPVRADAAGRVPDRGAGAHRAAPGDGRVPRLRAAALRDRRGRPGRLPARRVVLHHLPRAAAAGVRAPADLGPRAAAAAVAPPRAGLLDARGPRRGGARVPDLGGQLRRRHPGQHRGLVPGADRADDDAADGRRGGAVGGDLRVGLPRRHAAAPHRRPRSRDAARGGARRRPARPAAPTLLPRRDLRARLHGRDGRATTPVTLLPGDPCIASSSSRSSPWPSSAARCSSSRRRSSTWRSATTSPPCWWSASAWR
ncbi:MAG: tetratricopeptide repeat protein [Kofleriaceae bacterium]|nr:tetratricopeptide repeat protein [Kofleriaceae bacterium]